MAGLSSTLADALGDRYTVERELGRGGMAIVFLARDRRHDRLVALKTLRPELAHALGPERFLREIQIAARLQHPNILPLHDSGEINGLLYYVMPYVEGESLRVRLEREGQLPLEEALQIAHQVAGALVYAHSHGVVHRDIKPENILLSGDHALVADFGIARAITVAGGERLTETGLAVGTPAYMSPEQAAADTRVDARSDIYSLGCVVYEMIAGAPPFTGPSAQAVIARKLTDPVPPLRTVRESTPPYIEQIVLKSVSRAPADRFQSAARFADALAQGRTGVPVSGIASGQLHKARSGSRALRSRSFLISLAALAAVAGIGTLLWARESRQRWARNVALPEARRMEAVGRPYAAFRLVRQAETYLPDDPALRDMLDQLTDSVTVRTTPPGAQVLVRDFFDAPDAADSLGPTPLEQIRLPSGPLVWHISHPGYRALEVLGFTRSGDMDFSLTPEPEAPPGMVHVTGGPLPERIFELYSVRPVELDDYWLDQHEVTNRQFKRFVDEGGYQADRYWPQFGGEETTLTWEQAKQTFRDRTGRPGPATWEAGTYGEDQENFPVGGISWYEAAAYCAFVGKQLPTVYHWYNAGKFGFTGGLARFGNFQAEGPEKVGHFQRLGGSGTYDMAGNVKEWAWNQADSHRRYILGGAWNEPSYQFRDYDAQPPLDRQPTYGVRCARYQAADSATLMSRVAAPSRDYRDETTGRRRGLFSLPEPLSIRPKTTRSEGGFFGIFFGTLADPMGQFCRCLWKRPGSGDSSTS